MERGKRKKEDGGGLARGETETRRGAKSDGTSTATAGTLT